MAVIVYFVYGIVSPRFGGLIGNLAGNVIICIICGAAGVVVYGVMAVILRIDLIMDLLPFKKK